MIPARDGPSEVEKGSRFDCPSVQAVKTSRGTNPRKLERSLETKQSFQNKTDFPSAHPSVRFLLGNPNRDRGRDLTPRQGRELTGRQRRSKPLVVSRAATSFHTTHPTRITAQPSKVKSKAKSKRHTNSISYVAMHTHTHACMYVCMSINKNCIALQPVLPSVPSRPVLSIRWRQGLLCFVASSPSQTAAAELKMKNPIMTS